MQLQGAFMATMVKLTITTGNTLFQQAPNTTTSLYYKLTEQSHSFYSWSAVLL